MKAKVIRGSGFKGVLNYVFEKAVDVVAGNMAGNSPGDLVQEFSAVRQLRPDVVKPVWHCSLSLPQGECLSVEKWSAVAEEFMRKMGFTASMPWVAVRHGDTEHDHVHVVASRIALDGQLWHGKWEARKAIETTQELERVHGLTQTKGLSGRAQKRRLSGKEINQAVRTGNEPPRQYLQRLLDEVVKNRITAPGLAEQLKAFGVNAKANIASTGRMNGFSFNVSGVSFKGSDLGKLYTWAGLQKRGVTYVEIRDRKKLEQQQSGSRSTNATRGNFHVVAEPNESDASRVNELAKSSLATDSESFGTFVKPAKLDKNGKHGSRRTQFTELIRSEVRHREKQRCANENSKSAGKNKRRTSGIQRTRQLSDEDLELG